MYADENRQRITHSLLLKGGYSLNKWVTFLEEINTVQTHGLGDAVLMLKFIPLRISSSGHELQLGAGPKIPLGKSDLSDERGITLNADLQPGSGSWDAIT